MMRQHGLCISMKFNFYQLSMNNSISFKTVNFRNSFSWAFQFLGLAILLLLCFSAYFWNDDFYFYEEMATVGNLHTSLDMYFNWDGRGLSLIAMVRNFSVYYLAAYENALLATVYLGIQAFLIVKIVVAALDLPIKDKKDYIQLSLTCTFLLWLNFRSHIAYSHYWATGTVYATQNMLYLLWVYLYFFDKKKRLYGLALLTFILVLGGVYSAISVAALIGCDYLFYRKRFDKQLFLMLLCFVPAFLINVLAPGNYLRLSATQGDPVLDIFQLVLNFSEILRRFIMTSLEGIALGILVGLAIPAKKIDFQQQKIHRFWLLLLIAAIASLTPFALMPATIVNYVGIHFQSLLFLWTITFTCVVRLELKLYTFAWQRMQLALALLFLLIAVPQWWESRNVYHQIIHRHIILSESRGNSSPIYLPKIRYKRYFFSHLSYDIWHDPKEAHNQRLQKLYDTGPLYLIEEGPSSADSIPFQKNYTFTNYLDRKLWKHPFF
jgi:hypothetical protein